MEASQSTKPRPQIDAYLGAITVIGLGACLAFSSSNTYLTNILLVITAACGLGAAAFHFGTPKSERRALPPWLGVVIAIGVIGFVLWMLVGGFIIGLAHFT